MDERRMAVASLSLFNYNIIVFGKSNGDEH